MCIHFIYIQMWLCEWHGRFGADGEFIAHKRMEEKHLMSLCVCVLVSWVRSKSDEDETKMEENEETSSQDIQYAFLSPHIAQNSN